MPLTEWDDSYELGIPKIDGHHRKLVELLNNTYDQIVYSTDKDGIQTILQELIQYTDYHFAAEEQMMKKVNYNGLKMHIAKHNNFKKQLAEIVQDNRSETDHVTTDIVLFLWDWLKNHILKDDKKLIAHLSPK